MRIANYCSNREETEKLNAFIAALNVPEEPLLFKTSGSTGVPKEYWFSLTQVKISAQQTIDTFKLTQKDVLFCPFSMDYVAAKMMVARAYFLNATLVFTGPISNPFFIDFEEMVSFGALVPIQLQNALKYEEATKKINSIKQLIIGGALVSEQLEKDISEKVKSEIYHTYGMTETLTHVALRKLGVNPPTYKALKGVSVKVNSASALMVKSPVNQEWLQTNDLVELNGDTFKWIGRTDLVINSGGIKIHIELLESKFKSLLSDYQLFICGIESKIYGEECVVVVESPFNKVEELTATKSHFNKYEYPKKVVFLNEIPLLKSGKIDRVSLKKLATKAVLNGHFQNLK